MDNFSVQQYWENRYKSGRDSGAGSYGDEAEYKALIINTIIDEFEIKTIQEVGVGDGNNLQYYNIKEYYIGYDISQEAINICLQKFTDNTKYFFTTDKHKLGFNADLCLCLDVLFHQVEDNLYEETLDLLFKTNAKFVLIYSYDSDDNTQMSAHMKMRKVTDDIKKYTDYEMLQLIHNPIYNKYFILYKNEKEK